MGESLTEQCRVEVEDPWVVNFFSRRRSNNDIWGSSANYVPTATVIQRMQALSKMIWLKTSVGDFLSPLSNPKTQSWTGDENYQAEV